MTAARSFLLHRVRAIVRPSALTFRGGDQKIVADHSKSAGIPTCRDKAECALGRNIVNRIAGVYTRYIEYGDCVQRRIGDKQLFSVSALGKGGWKCSGKFLVLQGGTEHRDKITRGLRTYTDPAQLSECDLRRGLTGIRRRAIGVRAGGSRTEGSSSGTQRETVPCCK